MTWDQWDSKAVWGTVCLCFLFSLGLMDPSWQTSPHSETCGTTLPWSTSSSPQPLQKTAACRRPASCLSTYLPGPTCHSRPQGAGHSAGQREESWNLDVKAARPLFPCVSREAVWLPLPYFCAGGSRNDKSNAEQCIKLLLLVLTCCNSTST